MRKKISQQLASTAAAMLHASVMSRPSVPYQEMGTEVVELSLRHIIESSSSKPEIRRRIKKELRCPFEPILLSMVIPSTAIGRKASTLVKATQVLISKNGKVVRLQIYGPGGETIQM